MRTHTQVPVYAIVALCVVLAAASFASPEKVLSQGASGPITGYAWSDTIGWVSLNGSNYGLIADTNGKISGYAWSDSIGWITANESELSGCPSNPCRAKIQGGSLTGWLKALAGGSAQSGGWDGFISLSGSGYGVTQTGATIDGFAWGGTVVGWLDFDATTGYLECAETQGYFCDAGVSKHRDSQCVVTTNEVCSYLCAEDTGLCVPPPAPTFSSGGELRISPIFVSQGNTVKVSWEVENATSCTVTEDSPAITDAWTGVSSPNASCTAFGNGCRSSEIEEQTTYTLSCTGDGGTLSESETVSLNPNWSEI